MYNLKPKRSWLTFDGNSILRNKCQIVDPSKLSNDDFQMMNKMIAYIDATYNNEAKKYNIVPGIAIAANQLGVSKRIVYIHFNENGIEYKYMLMNPKIISTSVKKSYVPHGEGCLSVNDEHEGVSIRYKKVKVQAYDYLQEKEIIIDADGLLAICLQHEIDHLNGLLFYDRISENLNNAEPYESKEEQEK